MKAEERLKIIFGKKSRCPICKGEGIDPIQRSHKGPEPAPCRRCEGKLEIDRLRVVNDGSGDDVHIILSEEVRENGALVTHYQLATDFADKHREVLERSATNFTNRKRFQAIKTVVDKAMQAHIDTWIREGRV